MSPMLIDSDVLVWLTRAATSAQRSGCMLHALEAWSISAVGHPLATVESQFLINSWSEDEGTLGARRARPRDVDRRRAAAQFDADVVYHRRLRRRSASGTKAQAAATSTFQR
jgi:hypothetical protein